MKQILFGGGPGSIPDVATCYNRPFYSNSWTTTAARNFTVPVDTTFRKLHVKLDTAPGVGNSYTFTICDGLAGNSNTALAVTISGTDTEASNLVDEVVIPAEDATQLKCTRTGTPASANVAWSVEAETDTEDSFITSSNTNGTVVNNATRWLSTFGGAGTWANEDEARTLIPIHCTLRSYAINLNNSPGSGASFDFDLFKNGTIVASTTLSVADGNITGSLGGLSIDLAPGDFISVRYVPVNTPTARIVGIGVEYVPDTLGESFFADCIINNVTGTDRYRNFQGSSGQVASTDSGLPAYIVGETDFTLTDYYVSMETAPGAGDTRTFTILKNATPANNTITISNTNTSGSDLVNEDSYTKGDTFRMFWSSTGTPATTRDIHNSIVCFTGGLPPPDPIPPTECYGYVIEIEENEVFALTHSSSAPLETATTVITGDRLQVTATGLRRAGDSDEPFSREGTADGLYEYSEYEGFRFISLMGRIDGGSRFFVGTDFDEIMTDDGVLELCCRDSSNTDNSGSVEVVITKTTTGIVPCPTSNFFAFF